VRIFAATLIILLTSACATKPLKPAETTPDKVTVLTFNVENFFDNLHDEDKEDDTFLSPELKESARFQNKCRTLSNSGYIRECLEKDWSSLIVKRKLSRTADVVAQVEHGRGPDILILEEVENIHILTKWRDEYLKNMGYQTLVLIEGPDERGIDTAILSRLPLIDQPQLHLIDFTKDPEIDPKKIKPTRGILEAHLKMPNGDKLAVFAIHFPSQGAPTEFRRVALEQLVALSKKVPADMQVLIGGDFNITAVEDGKHKYFQKIAAPEFTISHFVGCEKCAGSIYYPRNKTWSFFDVLMFSKDFSNGKSAWQLDTGSIHLVNSSIYQTSRYGTPARFGSGKGPVGVSDHWPMYAELKLKKNETAGVEK
jgi:endonuclease/exonuclease/phosphatase family metal-dependent hydrolase